MGFLGFQKCYGFLLKENCLVHISISTIHSLDNYAQTLEKEVNIDFCRAMNRITFDKIVSGNPTTFSYVTIPEKEVEVVPDRGKDFFLWDILLKYIIIYTLCNVL